MVKKYLLIFIITLMIVNSNFTVGDQITKEKFFWTEEDRSFISLKLTTEAPWSMKDTNSLRYQFTLVYWGLTSFKIYEILLSVQIKVGNSVIYNSLHNAGGTELYYDGDLYFYDFDIKLDNYYQNVDIYLGIDFLEQDFLDQDFYYSEIVFMSAISVVDDRPIITTTRTTAKSTHSSLNGRIGGSTNKQPSFSEIGGGGSTKQPSSYPVLTLTLIAPLVLQRKLSKQSLK